MVGRPLRLRIALCTVGLTLLLASAAYAGGESVLIELDSSKADDSARVSATLQTSRARVRGRDSVVASEFYLPKGAQLNAGRLDECSDTQAEQKRCPKGALIARGTSRIDTSYETMAHLTATVKLYSGENVGELWMIVDEPETGVQMALPGQLKSAAGKGYSYAMVFKDIPTEPLGPESEVFIYVVNIKVRTVANGVYSNPSRCTGKGWRFGVRFSYENGGSGTATERVSCKS